MPDKERGGDGSILADVVFTARIFVLCVVLALTALMIFAFSRVRATDLLGLGIGFARVSALPLAVWACGVYALLLSVRLTVIALIVPLLALLWWLAAVAVVKLWAPPYELLAVCFLTIMVTGACITVWLLHAMAAERARGADMTAAVRAAFARCTNPGILAMLGACTGIAVIAYPYFTLAPAIGIGAALMLIVCLIVPPLAASALPLNEAFVARANRARELGVRIFSWLAVLAVPRWAFATIGIFAVLSAIVCLDPAFLPFWPVAVVQYASVFAGVGLLGAIGLADWRAFFSCSIPPFAASLLGAWASARFGVVLHDAIVISLLAGSAAGAGFAYFLAAPIGQYRRAGDPLMIAVARALSEAGAIVFTLTCTLALALLALAVMQNFSPAIALLPVFHLAGMLILLPAIVAALDDLFPRRRSVEELYRAR
jgi:hypothetical protein